MTGPGAIVPRPELPPVLAVQPTVRTAAGLPTTVEVTITNRAREYRSFAVHAHGTDPSWLPTPQTTVPVAPGATTLVVLVVTPAFGALAARYPLSVTAQAVDVRTGAASASPAAGEFVLVLDAPTAVGIALQPAEVTLRRRGRTAVVLTNSGAAPAEVRLEVQTPAMLSLRLADDRVVVPAGGELRVRATLRNHNLRLLGSSTRSAFAVVAHTSAAPRHVMGSAQRRTVFGASGVKLVALVAVVGLWVGLAAVALPKLASHLTSNQTKTQAAGGSAAGGAAGGSGSGGASGSGGSGGSGGSAAGGAAGAGGGGGGGAAGSDGTRLTGVMQGPAVDGVTVSITPTSLADGSVVGATPVGLSTQDFQARGLVQAAALPRATSTTVAANRSVVTGEDGTWSFPSLPTSGLYQVVFSKSGYQVQRFVVDASKIDPTQPLKVALGTGGGTIGGTVRGPDGAGIPGAAVSLTDGLTTVTTQSATTGAVGTWTVSGLSTPSTYFVTAGKNGYGTRSVSASVAASGSATADLSLAPGTAAVTGSVSGAELSGAVGGLGNVTVTATDGTGLTRTGTTVNAGSAAGLYTLPDLPSPGTYSIAFSSPGYSTVVQQVDLAAGQTAATASVTLSRSTGEVRGTVTNDGAGVAGAGLTLVGPAGTFKALSETATAGGAAVGTFSFTDVPPGDYVVTANRYATVPASTSVTVRPGQVTPDPSSPLVLNLVDAPTTTSAKGQINLTVVSQDGSRPIVCPKNSATVEIPCVTVYAQSTTAYPDAASTAGMSEYDGKLHYLGVLTASSGNGALPQAGATPASDFGDGLLAGQLRLTIRAPGFEPKVVSVQVGSTGAVTPPPVQLAPLAYVAGTVTGITDVTAGGAVCVVAYPHGTSGVTSFDGCTAATPTTPTAPNSATAPDWDPATSNTCTVTAAKGGSVPTGLRCSLVGTSLTNQYVPAACAAVTAAGYCLPGLDSGTYDVRVVSSSSEYPDSTPQVVGVAGSAAVTVPFVLGRLPRLDVTALASGPSGDVVSVDPAAGTTTVTLQDTVTGSSMVAPGGTAAAGGVFHFTGVPAGDQLSLSVNTTVNGTTLAQSSKVGPFTLDFPPSTGAPRTATIVAVKSWVPFTGQFGYVVDGAVQSVAVSNVSFTGVTGYSPDGSPAKQPLGNVTTNSDGCFFVVLKPTVTPPAGTPPPTGQKAGVCDPKTEQTAANTLQVTPDLVSSVFSMSAAGTTTYDPLQTSQTLAGQTTLQQVRVNPTPAVVDQTVAFEGTTQPDPTSVVVTPTATATNTGGISASVVSSGGGLKLQWTDTGVTNSTITDRTNRAVLGTYTVALSAPGYLGSTFTLTCTTPGGTCKLGGAATIRQLASLTVKVQDGAGTGVSNTNVSLALGAGGTGPISSGTTNGSGSVTFGGLTPMNTNGPINGIAAYSSGFAVSTSLSGYKTQSGLPVAGPNSVGLGATCVLTGGAAGATTGLTAGQQAVCTVTMPSYGRITGSVVTTIGPDGTSALRQQMSGVQVTAGLCTNSSYGNCATADTAGTTTTESDGSFTLPSTGPGLIGQYWQVKLPTLTASDYTASLSTNVDIGAAYGTGQAAFVLPAASFRYTLVFTASDSSTLPTPFQYSVTDSMGVPATQASDGSWTLYPRAYTVKVTQPGFQQDTFTLNPRGAGSTTFTVTPLGTTVLAKVAGPSQTAASAGPLAGVTVAVGTGSQGSFTVGNDNTKAKQPMTATTDPTGSVSLPSVPDGSWVVQVSKPGYVSQQQTITTKSPATLPSLSFTLVRIVVPVTVSVTVPSGDAGALTSVTLTPAAADTGNTSAPTLTFSGSGTTVTASFPSGLPSGSYAPSFAKASGHPGSVTNADGTAASAVVVPAATYAWTTSPTTVSTTYALNERSYTLNATSVDSSGASGATGGSVTLTSSAGNVGPISVTGGQTSTTVWLRTDVAYTPTVTAPTAPGTRTWRVVSAPTTVPANSTDPVSATVAFAQDVPVEVQVYVDGGVVTNFGMTTLSGVPAISARETGPGIFDFDVPQQTTYVLTGTFTYTDKTTKLPVVKTGTANLGPVTGALNAAGTGPARPLTKLYISTTP